ncbi:unnamed protein product [Arctogadus glacialis]
MRLDVFLFWVYYCGLEQQGRLPGESIQLLHTSKVVEPDPMMAYWAESQGQSPVYAKYCTVPGPNCTHMYHDRHKATYLPLPLCDQREPSCWTVPGSRTGGILHDYTNWTNPDLAAPAASHFPFGLDNPNKDRPQPQETRGGERRAGGYRGAPEREYELGNPNEGWQRRWEPGSSSGSLSDSSYRELQAWAARYSHSLPRRRRMGAEMKGAFQEAPETSRTLGRVNRHAPDPHMAALQRSESYSGPRGPMGVGGHQKTMTNNPLPVGQTSPLRFPLWREPGYTARMDKNSSLRCRALVNNSPTSKSTDMCGRPIDIEVRRFEIKEDEKAESCGGQLVIDTTSVLVRMELIPSPKKEHVNYLFHPPYNPPNVDTGLVEAIQTQVNPFPAPDEPEPQTDREEGDPTDLTHEDFLKAEELQPEKASDLCLPCLPQISPAEKETLTARAERILGIPLLDSNTELTCEETVTVPDLCSENEQQNEQETTPLAYNITDVLCLTEGKQKEMVTQLPDDHADESESEFVQDINIPQDVLDTEHNEDPEILRDGKPEISDCPDSKEDVIEDLESQDVEPLGSSVLHEQVFQTDGQEESTEENNPPNENNACSSTPSDPSDLQPESPPDFPCHIQHNSLSCESATETVPPSLFINDASENPETSTHTPQRPCSSTSIDVSPPPCEYILFPLPITSTPEHPFLNLHCLDSSVHPEDSSSAIEACEKVHELDDSLQLTNNDITDNTNERLFEDDTGEPGFCDEIAACPKDSIKDLVQPAKENNKEVTELEEQTASSEDNTTDFESLTEVNGLQKLTITTEPLFESCSQDQSNGETEGTGDDACPQSVIHCLDPSIVIKHTVDLQCSPCVSEIMPSLSDVSDLNIEEDSVPLELPNTMKDTGESQYPRSLWEAVNRIRKHTAPDSENEDEEVSELWDPQNAIEHLASIDDEGDMESEDIVFPNTEGIGKATVSSTDHASSDTEEELVLDGTTLLEEPEEEPLEDATVGLMPQDGHQEAGLQDEDTLSCSHINRQDLEETAVNSAEQVEEKEDIDNNPELVKEQETTNNKIPLDEEEKDICDDKVEESLVENEEGGRDETDTNHASVLSLPLGCDEIADCPKESIKDLVQPAEGNSKDLPMLEVKIAMLSVPPVTDVVQGVTE